VQSLLAKMDLAFFEKCGRLGPSTFYSIGFLDRFLAQTAAFLLLETPLDSFVNKEISDYLLLHEDSLFITVSILLLEMVALDL